MIGTLLSGVFALVLPLFASYRALTTNDISLIRPWLMYWVVFASLQFAESIVYPVLQLIPFYGLLRLVFLLWLVLPQTQGAVQLYITHLEPWLRSHDQAVDAAIARVLTLIHESPIVQLLAVLGIKLPDPRASAAQGPSPAAEGSIASSVTDMLMSRFRLPASADLNLAAYLPALAGGGVAGGAAGSPEDVTSLRNSLLGMLKSLDSRQGQSGTQAGQSPSRDGSDDYDIVEAPSSSPPPSTPGETEIEREVEAELRRSGAHSSTAKPADSKPHSRWW